MHMATISTNIHIVILWAIIGTNYGTAVLGG